VVLDPKDWWTRYITRLAVEILPVRVTHVDQLDALAGWHRDPFDRMLIWQCLQREWTLITRDRGLDEYRALGLKIAW